RSARVLHVDGDGRAHLLLGHRGVHEVTCGLSLIARGTFASDAGADLLPRRVEIRSLVSWIERKAWVDLEGVGPRALRGADLSDAKLHGPQVAQEQGAGRGGALARPAPA